MNDNLNKAVWPGWETVREIGKGSFGAVYEIQKDVLGMTDKAALKVITIPKDKGDIEELYSDGYDEKSITERYKNFLEDIVREYKMMAELKGNHNIVYCDDIRYIQHDDGFGWDIYIKMELLTPLTKAIKAPVDDKQVVKLGMDICNALKACEKKNIIHRDIKPQNIFVSSEGDYKLGDFGIAKTAEHISTGTKTGTFKYMAPEVYNNQPYGSSCDIYSLGMVLYWLLNERRIPFLPLPPSVPTATEDNDALLRRMSGEWIPAPIHGSEELKQIVLKACEPNPALRFATPSEMYEALATLSDVNASASFSDFDNIEDIFEDEEEETDETIGVFGRSKASNTKHEESVHFEEVHEKDKEPQTEQYSYDIVFRYIVDTLREDYQVDTNTDSMVSMRIHQELQTCYSELLNVGKVILSFPNISCDEGGQVSVSFLIKKGDIDAYISTGKIPKTSTIRNPGTKKQGRLDTEIEVAISSSQMALGCTVECIVPSTGERIMVTIPAGKKAGGTVSVPTKRSGNLTVRLSYFRYQKDEHKRNVWAKMSDAELWAYVTGCGVSTGGDMGRKIGLALLVFVLFCTGGAFFPPIGFVGFGVTAWVLIKPGDLKKNKEAAKSEWNKRYPNAMC
ncbi:MAG: protein kinase [Tyzzerella sp.]|nr:protein kinase [Tyzzerella sp.]